MSFGQYIQNIVISTDSQYGKLLRYFALFAFRGLNIGYLQPVCLFCPSRGWGGWLMGHTEGTCNGDVASGWPPAEPSFFKEYM